MSRLFAGTPFDIPPKCDHCEKLLDDCECPPREEPIARQPPESQTAKVRVVRRKHQRMITVVSGLEEPASDLPDVLSKLKAACGAGGTIKDTNLEIQGDHVQRVKSTLSQIGYRVK